MAKSGKPTSLASLGRILGALLAIVIVIFLTLAQANFLMGRALLIAFGDTESTHKSAWFEWDGDVVVKEFVLYPFNPGDESAAIRFQKVHLETPGWWWFIRNSFDRRLRTAKLDRIHLTLTGGDNPLGIDPTLGDLGPFGASASPFETEGCMSNAMWERRELDEMGLHTEPSTLEYDFNVQGEELVTTIVWETKGSSLVKLERRGRVPPRTNTLVLDKVASTTEFERWEVQDQGFVSARNRHCAKKDGIEARNFIERHVQSVERLLDTVGIGADEATRTAYRRFARDGGTFAFGGTYSPPLGAEELYELRDSGEAFTRIDARVENGGSTNTVQWSRFDPRPLAGLDDGEPTFAALQKERARSAPPDAAASAVPGDAAATAPATQATAPATDTTAAATTTAPTTPRHARRRRSEELIQDAPEPLDTATPDSGLARIEPPQSPEPGKSLQWGDLSQYRGHLIRVWTVHNPPRTVEILSFDGDSMRVAARLGGGNAEYTIRRSGFLKAKLIQ